MKAPPDFPQPIVEILTLELYFGAAPRTRKSWALAKITERRFEFSGAAFFGTGDLHYVCIEKLHLVVLQYDELLPFTNLAILTAAYG